MVAVFVNGIATKKMEEEEEEEDEEAEEEDEERASRRSKDWMPLERNWLPVGSKKVL